MGKTTSLPEKASSLMAARCPRSSRTVRFAAAMLLASGAGTLRAQDLAPRAYVITPTSSNAVTLGFAYSDGPLLFDGSGPITDASARIAVPSVAYYRSFSIFGRSVNVLAALPYGAGTFEGNVLGEPASVDRSGLFDVTTRISVNLLGGPAMSLPEMRHWQQHHLLGLSLKVVAPTGEYDPTRLINLGANRWAFKPELGYSGRFGHWLFDAYASVWFFTRNPEFFSHNAYVSGTQTLSQDSITAGEVHLSYDVRPRFWLSFDANFWSGGRTSVNNVKDAATYQKNSRVGLTAALPLTRAQGLKISYAQGAYIRIGGDYRTVSVAWQYGWIDRPK